MTMLILPGDVEFTLRPSAKTPRDLRVFRLGDGKPTSTEIVQPPGHKGILQSLDMVCNLALAGMKDPHVQAAGIRILKQSGNPQTTMGRAEAILKWVHQNKIWVPDPTHIERMIHPRLQLGKGEHAPLFEGGDCDDLTILTIGMLLAAILALQTAVGNDAAVVGHSYTPDREIGHVLGAVWDDKRWWYLEPSEPSYGFGRGKVATREIVYQLPSKKIICDAESCLRGDSAIQPQAPTEGYLQTISDRPESDTMEPHSLSSRPGDGLTDADLGALFGVESETVSSLGGAPGPLPPGSLGAGLSGIDWSKAVPTALQTATGSAWNAYMGHTADELEAAHDRVVELYDRMKTTLKDLGNAGVMDTNVVSKTYKAWQSGTGDFDWKFSDDQSLSDLLKAILFMATCCRDVVSGKRHLILTAQSGNIPAYWGVEQLSSDPYAVTVLNNTIALVPTNSLQMQVLHDRPGQLGVGPWAIAGIIAAALAFYGMVTYMVTTFLQVFESAITKVVQYATTKGYIKLINDGKATPAETKQIIDALTEQSKSLQKPKTPPATPTTEDSLWMKLAYGLGGVALTAVAWAAVDEYNFWGKTPTRPTSPIHRATRTIRNQMRGSRARRAAYG